MMGLRILPTRMRVCWPNSVVRLSMRLRPVVKCRGNVWRTHAGVMVN